MLQIPLTKIITCHHLNKRGSESNVLKIDAHDQTGHHTHFFQCSRTPVRLLLLRVSEVGLLHHDANNIKCLIQF